MINFFSIKWPDCTPDSKKSCDRENRSILQKMSWDYQNFSKWNSKFWITVYKGRPQEDEVFGLPGGNYPKEMGHQSRNLFQYGSGIKHSKKFSSLKDDIHSTSSSSKPTVVTDLGMYNWWFTFFHQCQHQSRPNKVGSFGKIHFCSCKFCIIHRRYVSNFALKDWKLTKGDKLYYLIPKQTKVGHFMWTFQGLPFALLIQS